MNMRVESRREIGAQSNRSPSMAEIVERRIHHPILAEYTSHVVSLAVSASSSPTPISTTNSPLMTLLREADHILDFFSPTIGGGADASTHSICASSPAKLDFVSPSCSAVAAMDDLALPVMSSEKSPLQRKLFISVDIPKQSMHLQASCLSPNIVSANSPEVAAASGPGVTPGQSFRSTKSRLAAVRSSGYGQQQQGPRSSTTGITHVSNNTLIDITAFPFELPAESDSSLDFAPIMNTVSSSLTMDIDLEETPEEDRCSPVDFAKHAVVAALDVHQRPPQKPATLKSSRAPAPRRCRTQHASTPKSSPRRDPFLPVKFCAPVLQQRHKFRTAVQPPSSMS